jgi:hypothetical protein
MGVINAKPLLELEEALEEHGLEDDATALRRTGRTLEVHLLTFIKKMRHRSRSSITKLVVQEEGVLLGDPCVVAAVAVCKDVQGLLVEVGIPTVAFHAAAEGLGDEVIGADGGTGKR